MTSTASKKESEGSASHRAGIPTLCRDPRQRTELFHKLADLKILSCSGSSSTRLVQDFSICEEKGWNDPPHRRYVFWDRAYLRNSTLRRWERCSRWILSILESPLSRLTSLCSSRFELETSASLKCTTQRLADLYRSSLTIKCGPLLRPCPWGGLGLFTFCTDAPEHVVRITGSGGDLAREKCGAPLMTAAEPVCSVYVDNIDVHGTSPLRAVIVDMNLPSPHWKPVGFALHEISRANSINS